MSAPARRRAPFSVKSSASSETEPAQAGSSAEKAEYEQEQEQAQEHAHEHEHENENENEKDGAFEGCAAQVVLDPFAPLDSDDIEWLQGREAKRRARDRRQCPHCGTVFHPVSPTADECPSLARHEARCRTASGAEREFYAAHRRWPRAGQVDGGEDEAA